MSLEGKGLDNYYALGDLQWVTKPNPGLNLSAFDPPPGMFDDTPQRATIGKASFSTVDGRTFDVTVNTSTGTEIMREEESITERTIMREIRYFDPTNLALSFKQSHEELGQLREQMHEMFDRISDLRERVGGEAENDENLGEEDGEAEKPIEISVRPIKKAELYTRDGSGEVALRMGYASGASVFLTLPSEHDIFRTKGEGIPSPISYLSNVHAAYDRLSGGKLESIDINPEVNYGQQPIDTSLDRKTALQSVIRTMRTLDDTLVALLPLMGIDFTFQEEHAAQAYTLINAALQEIYGDMLHSRSGKQTKKMLKDSGFYEFVAEKISDGDMLIDDNFITKLAQAWNSFVGTMQNLQNEQPKTMIHLTPIEGNQDMYHWSVTRYAFLREDVDNIEIPTGEGGTMSIRDGKIITNDGYTISFASQPGENIRFTASKNTQEAPLFTASIEEQLDLETLEPILFDPNQPATDLDQRGLFTANIRG